VPAYIVGIATSYESSAPSSKLGGYTPTDCAHEPFNPGLSFSYGSSTASTPSAVTVTATMPATEIPRRNAHVFANAVFLPLGTSINPAALTSLVACTDAQLAASSAAPAT